jgi:glyoxylase-like metal-dependent hydrolase (beta-lactamase superfamily II)
LHVVTDRMFGENTYIAHLPVSKECLIFDPGLEPKKIIQLLEKQGLTPAAILNTHGHADHIAGNGPLLDRWPGTPLMIGTGDATMLTDAWENLSAQFGIPITSPPADRLLKEGEIVEAAGFRLEVIDTPGHSAGHITYVLRPERDATTPADQPAVILFSGDVLFEGSIGRFDFPGGDQETLLATIREKFFTLPDDTLVLPGHGRPTTTGQEKEDNPFVRESSGR